MKAIWKWQLLLDSPTGPGPHGATSDLHQVHHLEATKEVDTVLQLPVGAEILCVHAQEESPCMWTLVDPSAPTETRVFCVYMTGQFMPDAPGKYIGTVLLHQGRFVMHVFEKVNP